MKKLMVLMISLMMVLPTAYSGDKEAAKKEKTKTTKVTKTAKATSIAKVIKSVKKKTLSKNVVAKASLDEKEIILTDDNSIVMNRAFRWSSVAEVLEKAKTIDSKLPSGYPMFLVMDTPGGGITAGLEFIEFLGSMNRPVHTVTLFAASMGFQAVQGLGNRYIVKYGILMAHKARGGFYGEFGDGASQIDARYGLWMKRILEMDKTAVKRSKGYYTLRTFRAAYENELWVNGFDAVKMGLADNVVKVKCDGTLAGTHNKLYRFWGWKFLVKFSNCPVNTGVLGVTVLIHTNRGYMELDKFLDAGGTLVKKNETSSYSGYYSRNSFYSSSKDNDNDREKNESPKVMRKYLSLDMIQKEKEKLLKTLNAPKQVIRSY